MNTKLCSKCLQEKPKTEFYKRDRTEDGLQYHCKECVKNNRKRLYYEEKGTIPRLKPKAEEGFKCCNRCLEIKPLEQFYSRKSTKDGKQGSCIECWKNHRRKGDFITNEVRMTVFVNDDLTCKICGIKVSNNVATTASNKANVDHIKPISKGGTNDIFNLQTLCRKCNRNKSNNEYEIVMNESEDGEIKFHKKYYY